MFWQVLRPTKLCEIPLLYKKTGNTNNSFSTFLKLTKLDKQCFYGLFKIVGGFGKFGDLPNFVKTRIYTWKPVVIPITLVLHSLNQKNMTYSVFMAYLSFKEVLVSLESNQPSLTNIVFTVSLSFYDVLANLETHQTLWNPTFIQENS